MISLAELRSENMIVRNTAMRAANEDFDNKNEGIGEIKNDNLHRNEAIVENPLLDFIKYSMGLESLEFAQFQSEMTSSQDRQIDGTENSQNVDHLTNRLRSVFTDSRNEFRVWELRNKMKLDFEIIPIGETYLLGVDRDKIEATIKSNEIFPESGKSLKHQQDTVQKIRIAKMAELLSDQMNNNDISNLDFGFQMAELSLNLNVLLHRFSCDDILELPQILSGKQLQKIKNSFDPAQILSKMIFKEETSQNQNFNSINSIKSVKSETMSDLKIRNDFDPILAHLFENYCQIQELYLLNKDRRTLQNLVYLMSTIIERVGVLVRQGYVFANLEYLEILGLIVPLSSRILGKI